jgi:conserved putative membrane protein
MKLIKSFFQNVSSRFLAVVTLLWLSVENAFATGGGNGINASKIPDFKIPGVDSNTKDPMEVIFFVAKGLATLAAVLFAAWAILTVVKALIKTYNAATDENDKKGWGPFVIALILGFILIFFSLWLVKMAIGLF